MTLFQSPELLIRRIGERIAVHIEINGRWHVRLLDRRLSDHVAGLVA